MIVMVVGLVALLLPADSIFRDDQGMLASFKAPVMQSIVSLLFVFTGAVGLTYGILVGKFKSPQDVTKAMEDITKTLVQLIVFYFFAAQFLYAFGASNMGALDCSCRCRIFKIFGTAAAGYSVRYHHFRCNAEFDYYFCFC